MKPRHLFIFILIHLIFFAYLSKINFIYYKDVLTIVFMVLGLLVIVGCIIILRRYYIDDVNEKFQVFKNGGVLEGDSLYKKLTIILSFICLLVVISPVLLEAYNRIPRSISSEEDFMKISRNLNGHYVLKKDIDLNNYCFSEKNRLCDDGTTFKGVLDGNGYTITNLKTRLFGSIREDALVKDLKILSNVELDKNKIGTVTNLNYGVIQNVHVQGDIEGRDYVGGIAGVNYNQIIKSSFRGNIIGNNMIGGITGSNSGNIEESYAKSTVTGLDYVGGLAGKNYREYVTCDYCDATISNSYFYGNVEGRQKVGGIAGYNKGELFSQSAIKYTISYANVVGEKYVGGIVGANDGPILNSLVLGNVTGDEKVYITFGGLVSHGGYILDIYIYDQSKVNGSNRDYGGFGRSKEDFLNARLYQDLFGALGDDYSFPWDLRTLRNGALPRLKDIEGQEIIYIE